MKNLRILLAALACTLPVAALHAEGYKLGETPTATTAMTDETGKPHTLAEYKGKPVVLEWTNYGCPFTRKHYDSGAMQKLQQTYTGKGVVWLSVISSAEGKQGYLTPATAPTAVAKEGFKGTHVMLDTKGTLGHAFGADTTPYIVILDKTGKVAYHGAIDSIPSFDAADIPAATNYAAKALDELLAGKPVSTAQTRSYGCSVKY